jgi:tRNA pseudouridine13 synthase
MKLKQIPEDFIVEEIFDFKKIQEKTEDKEKTYYYFLLEKRDYTQFKALEKVGNIFKVKPKYINFAGTKDRVGITKQIISIRGANPKTFENNIKYFNEKFEDLRIEFLGTGKARINLGDNIGNKFIITVRDLDKDVKIEKREKFLNYYDEQRFGYGNNSHLIGKCIIKNDIKEALRLILTSLPENPNEKLQKRVELTKKNWEEVIKSNQKVIDEILELYSNKAFEYYILKHLKNTTNDFLGAFRTIPKKLQSMYINAFQSFIFNSILDNINKLKINKEELELINPDYDFNCKEGEFVKDLLDRENISIEELNLPHIPELKPMKTYRDLYLSINNLTIERLKKDEKNKDKYKTVISFELGKGSYATNVVKQLFEQND